VGVGLGSSTVARPPNFGYRYRAAGTPSLVMTEAFFNPFSAK